MKIATFRDPLTRRVTVVEVLEPVRFSAGSRFLGHGFNVRDERGRHFTVRANRLQEVTQ